MHYAADFLEKKNKKKMYQCRTTKVSWKLHYFTFESNVTSCVFILMTQFTNRVITGWSEWLKGGVTVIYVRLFEACEFLKRKTPVHRTSGDLHVRQRLLWVTKYTRLSIKPSSRVGRRGGPCEVSFSE